MNGLTEFSNVFCQITLTSLVLLNSFKVRTEICLSSWEIAGVRIPKVMPAKLRLVFLPLVLVLLSPFFFA